MATWRAIAATANAITRLIDERYPRGDPANGGFGTLSNRVVQSRDVEAGLTGDGFAVLLWRVAINSQRRNHPPRVDVFGRRFKPSLPVDLSFLIIPFRTITSPGSAEPLLDMLGWAMRGLEDAGPLTASYLNEYAPDIFTVAEDVDLVCDPLSHADQLTLWDRMRRHPLSVNYTLRMVLLDSDQVMTDAAPVVERNFDFGIPAS
jgi:hypothetical protein